MPSEADRLVLEAQVAMNGLTMKQYLALSEESQARIRKTALEATEEPCPNE